LIIVKSSKFWKYVRPNINLITFYTYRDYVLTFTLSFSRLAWIVAYLLRRLGYEPY
jgi:hypothetical protein